MTYIESLCADPLWVASQASAKRVHNGNPLPHDRTIMALYLALEDKTIELKNLALKVVLLASSEPSVKALLARHSK